MKAISQNKHDGRALSPNGCSSYLVGSMSTDHYPGYAGAPFQPSCIPPITSTSMDRGFGILPGAASLGSFPPVVASNNCNRGDCHENARYIRRARRGPGHSL